MEHGEGQAKWCKGPVGNLVYEADGVVEAMLVRLDAQPAEKGPAEEPATYVDELTDRLGSLVSKLNVLKGAVDCL